jgi:hypothetical protein
MRKLMALGAIITFVAVAPAAQGHHTSTSGEIAGAMMQSTIDDYEEAAAETGVSFARAVKCGIHLTGFVAGNALAIKKLQALGGVKKVVSRLLRAQGSTGKLQVLSSAFAEMTGVWAVVDACGG